MVRKKKGGGRKQKNYPEKFNGFVHFLTVNPKYDSTDRKLLSIHTTHNEKNTQTLLKINLKQINIYKSKN